MHGFLNIDKPAGMTSFDVIRRLKRLLATRVKIGHLGTLDPMATGVLPIALGHATRLIPFIDKGHKQYRARMLLGGISDTEDAWGQITMTGQTGFDPQRLSEAVADLTGAIEQVPPMYSALHHQGKRLYELARQGEVVDRPARQVHIFELSVVSISEQQGQPLITLEVVCSPGTYVRSLCRDIGSRLGTGAYLCELRRLRDGLFGIEKAVPLERLTAADANMPAMLLPMDYPLQHWPAYQLRNEEEGILLRQGRSLPVTAGEAASLVRVYERSGRMAAVGRLETGKPGLLLKPIKVFHPD